MDRIACPVCTGQTLSVRQIPYDIPYFGKVLIIVMQCSRCGFSHRDVLSLEEHEPSRYEVTVEGLADLNIRVVRSSTATVRIPELGVCIEPGPMAEGFISNVEGLLERVVRVVGLLNSEEDPAERAKYERFLRRLREAREGRTKFTLILEDPLGNSAIISEKEGKVRRRRLTEREVRRLKTGYLTFRAGPCGG